MGASQKLLHRNVYIWRLLHKTLRVCEPIRTSLTAKSCTLTLKLKPPHRSRPAKAFIYESMYMELPNGTSCPFSNATQDATSARQMHHFSITRNNSQQPHKHKSNHARARSITAYARNADVLA